MEPYFWPEEANLMSDQNLTYPMLPTVSFCICVQIFSPVGQVVLESISNVRTENAPYIYR
jgi:hypothetical protein